jgi:acetyl esterase/lipase
MKIMREINYALDGSDWHLGDLHLPAGAGPHPIALAIHGGGWSAYDRSSFAGVAEFLCALGFATFNIEYRLLGTAPWPACGDDCLQAARFLLAGGDQVPNLQRDKLFVVGASAGGHLSLMTGLRLPREKVSGVVSISGVCDFAADDSRGRFQLCPAEFWGHEPSQAEFAAASPMTYVDAGQPPVLCTHCPNDDVVGIVHSRNFVERCRAAGAEAELFEYERPADGHCIWIPGSNPHRLFPEIEAAIRQFADAWCTSDRS